MGSVSSLPGGLAALSQPGGLLTLGPVQLTTANIQAASPQDLVSLSDASLALQQVSGLFGVSTPVSATTAATALAQDIAAPGSEPAATTASTAQQAATTEQSQQSQLLQALFATPTVQSGGLNTFG